VTSRAVRVISRSFALASLLVAASSSGASKEETETYSVGLVAKPSYAAGRVGVVEIVIDSKAGYKINDKYPTKFTVDPAPSGLSIPKKVLRTADGAFTEKRGVLKLQFVPSQAGKLKLGGQASFSVCSASACVVGKKHLEVVVNVL
jgi:hypothetical protein